MEGRRDGEELFRRSWLTTLPEGAVAVTISLAIGLAALHLGLWGSWQVVAVIAVPLLWGGGRALQWACHTWTVMADGRLVVVRGVLFRTRLEVRLGTAIRVMACVSPALRWLNVGAIAFEARDRHERFHQIEGTWMGNHSRLCEVVHARGRAPCTRQLRDRQAGAGPEHLYESSFVQAVRLPDQEHLKDYGRFMAFCHHLLRAGRGGRWPPAGMPRDMMESWMEVLGGARVIIATQDDRGWQIGEGIVELDDICRRIGPRAFQRAVRRIAWSRLGRVRAT